MIGRCVHATGLSLGVPTRGAFYTNETAFSLTLGTEYHILGMGIFDLVLLVLTCDDTGKPNWLPIGVFDFNHATVPNDWEFVLVDGFGASGGDVPNQWVALWGYPELVSDPSHSDRLIERDPAALEIFYRELSKCANDPG